MLEADRARVAELELEILQLECAVSALRIEQAQAQERLDGYRYPVLTLPNELVSEIFLHILPPYPDFPELVGPFSPTALTQICRHWRDVAVRTPELWSAVSIDNPHEWQAGSHEANSKFLQALIPYRARWVHLDLGPLAGSGLRILEAPMPLIQHLELSGEEVRNVVLREVPRLRSIALPGNAVVTLPWAQLTSFTVRQAFYSQCVRLLAQARNLIHCELEIVLDSMPRVGDVTLPGLGSLAITYLGGGPNTRMAFLTALFVPALRSLRIPESFLEFNHVDSLVSRFLCEQKTIIRRFPRLSAATKKKIRRGRTFYVV
ncbi:hypothetical protein DFH06DRAFT_1440189 [Mycena polygramma]|nr:hypothetical protein DFH06DRAFT_1440189 [Mycena polygramma]